MGTVTIDFIARPDAERPWSMILVEEGPWADHTIESNLRRLQDRLYGCIDAALDGQLAGQFPETVGEQVLIRVHGYDIPEERVRSFFDRFAGSVLKVPDYAAVLAGNPFVAGISFELNLEYLRQ
jgi:hypothetical protein